MASTLCSIVQQNEVKTTVDGRTYHAPELVRAVCLLHDTTGKGWRTIAREFAISPNTIRNWIRGTRRLRYVRQRNQNDDGT